MYFNKSKNGDGRRVGEEIVILTTRTEYLRKIWLREWNCPTSAAVISGRALSSRVHVPAIDPLFTLTIFRDNILAKKIR